MTDANTKLEIGSLAPKFKAMAIGGDYGNEGKQVQLDDFKGKTVILYFYPKDDTPGCTKQACSLRDNWADIKDKAIVFGISVDSAADHKKFIEKYSLPFPLLSDENKEIVNAYGVWGEKNMFGKKYMGSERSTFIIDAEGKLKAILPKVKPEEHTQKVLTLI